MSAMKVYISGKITGTTDYMERFDEAERKLKVQGFEVVNPARENAKLPADKTSWRQYMGESLKMLMECDAIYPLPDWVESKGARIEIAVADRTGMAFIYDTFKEVR